MILHSLIQVINEEETIAICGQNGNFRNSCKEVREMTMIMYLTYCK